MRATSIWAAMLVSGAFFGAMPAGAVAYMTDTEVFKSQGDTIGSAFDVVTLGGVTGDYTGPGTYKINAVSFLAGLNATVPGITTGIYTDMVTVNGQTFSYSIDYELYISTTDTLILGGNSEEHYGYTATVNPLTLSSSGDLANGILTVTVTQDSAVPEPGSWALMVGGFGLVGAGLRRRNGGVVQAI